MPERIVAYTESPIDVSPAGFVLADPSDYPALVIAPADPTLRATAKAWGTDKVTDPIVAAHDVLRTATTGDENEAVDKLRDLVVQRFAMTQLYRKTGTPDSCASNDRRPGSGAVQDTAILIEMIGG